MTTNFESGDQKNISSFRALISFVTSYGNEYKPAKKSITIPKLQQVLDDSIAAMNNLKTATTPLNEAINSRAAAFDGIRTYSTRIISAMTTCEIPEATIDDARRFQFKLYGRRAGKKKAPPVAPKEGEAPSDKQISVSQQSFDMLYEHFSGLHKMLEALPAYAPNETDLQLSAISEKSNALLDANVAVINAYTNFSNTRQDLINTMYAPVTGMVDLALSVKEYLKGVYTPSGQKYLQVKSIPFKTIKGN